MISIYLASRFARGDELDGYGLEAAEHGLTVTSRWHSGQHGDPNVDSDLNDPAMPRYAAEDIVDLRRADAVVSFTEGGGGKGGRHVEFGMGLALGKRLVLVGPREHVFHTHPSVEQYDAWPEALAALEAFDSGSDSVYAEHLDAACTADAENAAAAEAFEVHAGGWSS